LIDAPRARIDHEISGPVRPLVERVHANFLSLDDGREEQHEGERQDFHGFSIHHCRTVHKREDGSDLMISTRAAICRG